MPNETQVGVIHEGKALLQKVRENAADLPGVSPFLHALEMASCRSASSLDRRATLTAASQEATRQLNEDLAASRTAIRALRHYIKGVLGIHDARLVRYGIRPVRRNGQGG